MKISILLQATDRDSGLFAKIKYNLNDNTDFGIDEETGLVYPLKDALADKDEILLVATATDEDGAGLSTSVNLKIKKLEGKHFTVLTIANEYIENIDDIIARVQSETSIELHILRAAIISAENDNIETRISIQAVKADDEETLLRLIVYAFDADDNPIETDILKE